MPPKKLLYFIVFMLLSVVGNKTLLAQCSSSINTYPYTQDFEASNGGWFSGGTNSSWVWGIVRKNVITQAASGTNCWVTGGLADSQYNNGEYSYIQSPCFDLSSLTNPYLSVKIFWETENRYDGASMQYSIDSGKTFMPLGTYADGQSCPYDNWFNTQTINTLGGAGWTGNIQPTAACNGGVGGGLGKWVSAKHTLNFLLGQTHVIFRFMFGAGTQCNSYDGFAMDDFTISEAPANNANFTYTCSVNRYVQFNGNDVVCPSTYTWDFGEPSSGVNNIASGQAPSHTYSVPGTFTVTLTVTHPTLGTVTSTQTINVVDVSTSVIKNVDCYDQATGSAQVQIVGAANNYQYIWNTVPVQNTAVVSNVKAGTYTVTIIAPNTCTVQATATITQPSAATVQAPNLVNPKCTTQGSIQLNLSGATPPYTYQWLPNVSTTNNASNLMAGKYVINVLDANNCFLNITDISLVNIPNTLAVNIGRDTIICPGETYILNAGTGYSSYRWQNFSTQQSFSVTSTGNYYVTVADKDGCTASDSAYVTVNCDDVFFPSAFSPNGDYRNETFGPLGNVAALSNYAFKVFNRLGEVIFTTTNPTKKWDGRVNGNLQTGVFVWYANYSIRSRKNLTQKGTVLIVR
jgi:gliding motility-associated-like protein